MSEWFKTTRQEFIMATIRMFGQVRRSDLMRQFDISSPQASNDISNFLASNPGLVEYDVRGKTYVVIEQPQPPCGECHIQPGETCDICGRKGVLHA